VGAGFGHDWDETCMQMDEVLASTADTLKNYAGAKPA
jgi:DIM1 family U5 snRNP protein